MKSRVCEKCQASFEYEPAMWGDKEVFTPRFCFPCVDAMDQQKAEEGRRDLLGARRERWKAICPSAYRESDLAHPGLSVAAREALQRFDPHKGRFLGLCGATGRGKTRLSFLRLRDFHMDGLRVFFISAKRLERLTQQQFSDDREIQEGALSDLRLTRRCQVLLLDDVGKEKMTERVAGEFYDLVEHRSSNGLAMIWTANLGPEDLRGRLGDEHGPASLRRLLEFSDIEAV